MTPITAICQLHRLEDQRDKIIERAEAKERIARIAPSESTIVLRHAAKYWAEAKALDTEIVKLREACRAFRRKGWLETHQNL